MTKSLRARVEKLEAPQGVRVVDIAAAILEARKKPRLLQTPAEIALMQASPDPRIRAIAGARCRVGHVGGAV